MDQLILQCRNSIITQLSEQFRARTFSPLVLNKEMFFSGLNAYYSGEVSTLPDYYSPEAGPKFIAALKKTDVQKMLHFKQNFESAFYKELSGSSQVSSALEQFLDSMKEHEEELEYLAGVSVFAGGAAFLAGTVFQIVYDFINTVISLLSFAGNALWYVGDKAYTAIAGTDEPRLSVDVSILKELIQEIDLEKFFLEDLPSFVDEVFVFAIDLANDMADDAAKWGKDTASYILAVAGNSFHTGYSLFFDPLNPEASIFEKIWWAIRQWFYLGTLFGPMIVDIVLFFCSGSVSGYFSAANKLGKLGKLGELFSSFKYFGELKNLSVIRIISDKWSESRILRELVEKIYGRLIDLAMGAAEKLKTFVSQAYKMISRSDEIPELEVILKQIDEIYDKAQNIDFFISMGLLLLGFGFDESGDITFPE